MAKTSETDKFRDIRDMVGPAAGLLYGAAGGAEDVLKGNYFAAAKKALPVAVQNILKGGEMLATGEAKDSRNQFVTDVTPAEAAAKMAGFNPNAIADIQRASASVRDDEQLRSVTSTDLMDRYVNALVNNRGDDLEEAKRRIMDWNESHPDMRITLSPSAIRRRIALSGMTPEQRAVKLAPKSMRAGVAETMDGSK